MRVTARAWTAPPAVIMAVAAFSMPAAAQDEGGLQASLTFAQGINASDDEDAFAQTELNFLLSSQTRTQSLSLNFGTRIEERFEDGFDADIADPFVVLNYGLENRQTALQTRLSYRETDADTLVEEDDFSEELVLDEGDREDLAGSFTLDFGREALFGGTVDLGYRETQFSGTTSDSLIDSVTQEAAVTLRFEITPTFTATAGFDYSDIDRDDGRDVREETVQLGAILAITPSLRANLSFGPGRVTVNEDGIETIEDGTDVIFGLTQDRPNGTLTFSADNEISETGRRSSARVGRAFDTPGGTFAASIGITETDQTELRPLYEVSYRHELPRGFYSISLDQGFFTSSDGVETFESRLQLGWEQELTRVSRFNSDLTLRTNNVIDDDDDTARVDFGVSYSHDITADWAVTTRYTHSRFARNNGDDETEQELFIGLQTVLGWRP